MKIYSKQELIESLLTISKMGWIQNTRRSNHGSIGNTLEDLLGIEENNLPIPNASEWELKTQRIKTTALTTLTHIEPSPRAIKFVPAMLLPHYGWQHQNAGQKYPLTEMSFRQTLHGLKYSDRGFTVKIDRTDRRIVISFNSEMVSNRHANWLEQVASNIGLGELDPQPYWGFDDLEHKVGTKLINCFFVQAQTKRENGVEYYWYQNIAMLENFSFDAFLKGLEDGFILIDFDARTGHNHGTKFRLRQNYFPQLYKKITNITSE